MNPEYSHWDYRVVHKVNTYGPEPVDEFTIHAVFYDVETKEPRAWIEEPARPYGEDDEGELFGDFLRMQEAFRKPNLEYDEMPGAQQKGNA
jgi:hypothetical protein